MRVLVTMAFAATGALFGVGAIVTAPHAHAAFGMSAGAGACIMYGVGAWFLLCVLVFLLTLSDGDRWKAGVQRILAEGAQDRRR